MVVMGTGKNMVRSIRYWGMVCQLWDEVPGTRGQELHPLEMGTSLLADDGWDPFLEDEATAWLLHWLAVTNGMRGTTWSWIFSRQKGGAFSKTDILAEIDVLVGQFGMKRCTRPSLKRDVDVFINSYLRTASRKGDLSEDALDCPFRQLGLLRPGSDRATFELVSSTQPSLPDGIFFAALVDYLARVRQTDAKAVAFDELMYAPLSPGRVFRLTEENLAQRLAHCVERGSEFLDFAETAGLRQVLLRKHPPTIHVALRDYYKGLAR